MAYKSPKDVGFEEGKAFIRDNSPTPMNEEVPCAWHENNADPEGTHGICERCEFQIYGKWQMSKVPSYVERFRNRKEK